jgi:hypothetical protein
MTDLTHEEMLDIAAERERPFYRYFVIDYCATGEGKSVWLKICRNYQPIDDKDRDLERFAKFVGDGADYYMHGLEQPTLDEFLEKYGKMVPDYIVEMIARQRPTIHLLGKHIYTSITHNETHRAIQSILQR